MWAHRADTRLFAALAVCLGLAGTAWGETLKGAEANAEAQSAAALLGKVETLTADFDMVTPGGVNQGKIFVDRDRKAIRIEFAPPMGHLVLVDGPVMKLYGGDGTRVRTATSGTPFAFLMNPEQALVDDIDVLQVQKQGENLVVAVAQRGKKSAGQIILQFRGQSAWRLIEWGMFDKNGGFTQTRLKNVRTNALLDDDLFRAPEEEQSPE
jgi:outer membrane lipoprotein-sorting protein